MVLNLNYFKPGNPLPDGTLYVGEQVPGTYLYNDYTEVLSRYVLCYAWAAAAAIHLTSHLSSFLHPRPQRLLCQLQRPGH